MIPPTENRMHSTLRYPKHGPARPCERNGAERGIAIQAMSKRTHAWHAHLPEIVEATTDFIAIMDDSGRLRYINRAGRAMLGLSDFEDVERRHISDCHPEAETRRLLAEAFPIARRSGAWRGESTIISGDGQEIAVSQVVLAHGCQNGGPGMFSTIARDISERKRYDAKIRRQATHDPLTGLPNRIVLEEHLTMELARMAQGRRHAHVAVMLLDLDNFKRINDSLGHVAGDELLRSVAQRLRNCLRSGDMVARYGDDEFTIVVSGLSVMDNLLPVIHKLRAAFELPFPVAGQEVFTGFSTGIAVAPNDGGDPVTLLKNADAAMYRAKASGRDRYRFYAPEMNARGQELLALETELRHALDREEFVLHYQPQLHLCTGRIAGFEALLRWQHPAGRLVPPSDFIPMLEETGLIIPVGKWTLRRACAEYRKLRDASGTQVPVSVNVSARQFGDHRLVEELRHILRDEGMPPEDLELEITESTVMQDTQAAGEILDALNAIGVRLAIDDFGTGHSSLAYLKRFPLNTLKIDRDFIQGRPWEENDAAIAEACISLGHKLGLDVIAEGVETAEQMQFLRAHGCDMIQGYHFSPPMPLQAASHFALHHKARAGAEALAQGVAKIPAIEKGRT